MVVADLHVHTSQSDGILELAELPRVAHAAGLQAIAVTDHDRLHPDLSAPVETREGVSVIHGIELRVETETQRIDLLGYGATRTPALTDELERLERDRIDRARAIVSCLEDRLDVTIDVEFGPGIGRPHIAAAAAHAVDDLTPQAVFAEYIGDEGPCYVPRAVPDFGTAHSLLADACTFVGLAHPLRYDDPADALGLTPELDAVERFYPYDESVDPAPIDAAISNHGLLVTGGSDAHGRQVGAAGLDKEYFGPVATTLGIEQ